MGREVGINELIQNDVNPKKIEMELSNLLSNNKIKDDYKKLRNIIGENNAANKIVSHIQKKLKDNIDYFIFNKNDFFYFFPIQITIHFFILR